MENLGNRPRNRILKPAGTDVGTEIQKVNKTGPEPLPEPSGTVKEPSGNRGGVLTRNPRYTADLIAAADHLALTVHEYLNSSAVTYEHLSGALDNYRRHR